MSNESGPKPLWPADPPRRAWTTAWRKLSKYYVNLKLKCSINMKYSKKLLLEGRTDVAKPVHLNHDLSTSLHSASTHQRAFCMPLGSPCPCTSTIVVLDAMGV